LRAKAGVEEHINVLEWYEVGFSCKKL
jgi:hypothetical protein